jgi:2-methylcitrate dehydratase PrpD
VLTLNPTDALAEFAVTLSWDRLPHHVAERVKALILDALASALLGYDANEVRPFVTAVDALGPGEDATIIGGGRTSLAAAAMANGYLITAVTVCDIHRPTSCHVMPEVLPPALASAEVAGSSGRDLLLAVAVGAEVTTRVGLALKTEVFDSRGWHMPGNSGPFGGAAAVGRLLGLDEQGMANALGIAGSQATGSYAQLRTPAIKFQQARGALAGLLAGQFASAGLRAAQDILLHPDGGLLRTHSDGGRPEAATAGLGGHWELEQISMRPWPTAVHLQPLVTSLLELSETAAIDPGDIAEVRVELSAAAYEMHGRVDWNDRFRSRLSAPYVTGVVLHDRECGLAQFRADRLQDAALAAFVTDRVRVLPSADLSGSSVRVTITRLDGEAHVDRRDIAKGDPANPLSRADVESKFRQAAEPILGRAVSERVVDLVSRLEDVRRVDELTQCLGHR